MKIKIDSPIYKDIPTEVLDQFMETNRLGQIYEHDRTPLIDLSKVSHIVTSLSTDFAEIEILDTPNGRLVKNRFENNERAKLIPVVFGIFGSPETYSFISLDIKFENDNQNNT